MFFFSKHRPLKMRLWLSEISMCFNDYYPLQAVAHFLWNAGPAGAVNKATVRVRPLVLAANASFIMFACDL